MQEAEIVLHAHGMHCHGCEKLIARTVGALPGVMEVYADYPREIVTVRFDAAASTLNDIRATIEKAGYRVFAVDAPRRRWPFALRALGALAALAGVALIVFFDANWITDQGEPDVTQHLSVWLLFLLGLLTGFHCVGMCGAFVLSYAADAQQQMRHPFVAHFLYAAGKTLSYTAIGALFGLIGAAVSFTPALRGAVGVAAGAFLIVYGLNTLGFLTPLRRFRLGLPKALQDFVERESYRPHRPFVVGCINALMIACGPLQAMYISAAGTGSALEGAKMLFAFGLGTLPMLTAFGLLTSVISGALTHRLLKLSGVLVVLLGAVMLNRGLILTGAGYDLGTLVTKARRVVAPPPPITTPPTPEAPPTEAAAPAPAAAARPKPIWQTIDMDVIEEGFSPNHFVLAKGVPVKWRVNGKRVTNCNKRILVPAYKLEIHVRKGGQTVEFTPQETGVVRWSCWMGMLLGEFNVVDALPETAEVDGARVAKLVYPRMAPTAAAEPTPQRYVVAPGDTLTRIAKKIYGDAARAGAIAAANPAIDPKRLRPGATLSLPAR